MENGDILYIVITIIFLLSGLFKKNKKTERQKTARSAPFPAGEVSYDDTEPQVFNEENVAKQQSVSVTTSSPINQERQETVSGCERKQTRFAEKTQADSPLNAPHSPEHIKLDTAEEARKAFIYSEIFNRKY